MLTEFQSSDRFLFLDRLSSVWDDQAEIFAKQNDCPANYQNELENPEYLPVCATFYLDRISNSNYNIFFGK